MKIIDLSTLSGTVLFSTDDSGRQISIYAVNDVVIVGKSICYPNTLLFSAGRIYNPVEEVIMSLRHTGNSLEYEINVDDIERQNVVEDPVFFFIYNTDNYFHFLYDSLPYLITYLTLKKKIKNLKILMTYPNDSKKELYRFVSEFLTILGLDKDVLMASKNTVYKKMMISSSYTHGHDSNLPPRNEIYEFYKTFVKLSTSKFDKIYVSRRSWLHGDFSNIGTNYTTRRKMVNEDELVEKLIDQGFTEVFTEKLSTTEKIEMFANAKVAVGAMGGGIANVLFSKPDTKLVAIVSPGFLDINARFKYALNKVDVKYAVNTKHFSTDQFKRYMRVVTNDGIIGEISHISGSDITIEYSENKISGWNHSAKYLKKNVSMSNIKPLDNGLNSEWVCDIDEVLKLVSGN